MPTGSRVDPYLNYYFKLEFDGIQKAGFRECSGLDSTTAVVQYREGTDSPTTRKLPGQGSFDNVSLKYGTTDDHSLYDWAKKFLDGKGTLQDRKNFSIVLMDTAGEEKLRWNFVSGWITKWTGPSFNATANDVAVESIEIAHEGVAKA